MLLTGLDWFVAAFSGVGHWFGGWMTAFVGTWGIVSLWKGASDASKDAENIYSRAIKALGLRQLNGIIDLMHRGYMSPEEFLGYIVPHHRPKDMLGYYKKFGFNTSTQRVLEEHLAGHDSLDGLVKKMGLRNLEELKEILAPAFFDVRKLRAFAADKGQEISIPQAMNASGTMRGHIRNLSDDDRSSLLAEAQSAMEDPRKLADLAAYLEDKYGKANSAAAAAASHHEPVLGANAFVDVTGRRPDRFRREESIAGEPRNFDALHANITLAMRRMEPEEKGIASFRTDDGFRSSFQSVSFASPFQSEAAFGAERRVGPVIADLATNF